MAHVRVRLLEVLARRRMKMSDLHRETGIAYSSIHRIGSEKAQRLDLKHIAEICAALECEPGDLLEFVPNGPKS